MEIDPAVPRLPLAGSGRADLRPISRDKSGSAGFVAEDAALSGILSYGEASSTSSRVTAFDPADRNHPGIRWIPGIPALS